MGDSVLAAHLCVECKLDLNVFSFMLIGVFLESRVTSVKVSRTYFSLSAFYHSCLNTPVFVMSPPLTRCLVFFFFFFPVCTCVVHKRCHQQVVTVCPRMKKTAKEQVTTH